MTFVTRADVAARAGTSVAVVSYVVNDGPRTVAPATRQRVQRAIQELGYVPNRSAQALAGSRTFACGLLLPDISNPFFASLAHALQDEAMRHGLTLLLGDSGGDKDREQRLLATFLEQRVRALIVVGVDDSPHLEAATRYGVPVVMLDRVNSSPGFSSVCIDNYAAARLGTELLIEAGHRRVGFVGGPHGLGVAAQRLAGYRAALHDHGIEEFPGWNFSGEFSKQSGYAIGSTISQLADRPDAVFVSSDQQAIGLLAALLDRSISVPGDLAMVSLDGTDDGRYTRPPLTSVLQPVDEIARQTMDMVTGSRQTALSRVTIPHRLILGRSSGSAREAGPAHSPSQPGGDLEAHPAVNTQQRSYE